MKTKEEIIHQYYENGGYDGGYSEDDVEKMMDEYAKEMAFDMWKLCNGYTLNYPMEEEQKAALWENLKLQQEKSSLK